MLAVIGTSSVEVFTLSSSGNIISSLAVNLLLEAYGQTSLVNVEWVPGSQTMMAIGAPQFIKIYDLAEDNISPTHNLTVFENEIKDYTFVPQE